jgi:ATP-binding cassette subfamily F protein 1
VLTLVWLLYDRMGIYNQHFVDKLPMEKTPIEFLCDRFEDEDYQSVRNRLGKYGLEGHAHEVNMRDLSGGQKARVTFVELSLSRPHVLLFGKSTTIPPTQQCINQKCSPHSFSNLSDEPTNNLDVESIDALLDAINAFNGGVVVVTHDQRLIEECDCALWVVEKKGVTEWKAGFDDYKENILNELEREIEKDAAVRRGKLEAAAAAKALKIERLAKKLKK